MIPDAEKVFPDMEGLETYLEDWYTLGLASSNGMGQVPLSFQEIEAYARIQSLNVDAGIVRRMSVAYCMGITNGSDKAAFPPYPKIQRNPDVDTKLRNALDFLKKPDRQKAKIVK